MLLAVVFLLFVDRVVCCLLITVYVWYLLFGRSYILCILCCLLLVVCVRCLVYVVVCGSLSVVHCLSFIVCWLLCSFCCVLLVVRCLLVLFGLC